MKELLASTSEPEREVKTTDIIVAEEAVKQGEEYTQQAIKGLTVSIPFLSLSKEPSVVKALPPDDVSFLSGL